MNTNSIHESCVVLLFGVGRISKVAGELGSGVRAFREGVKENSEEVTE